MDMRRVDELGRVWVRTGLGDDDWAELGPFVGGEIDFTHGVITADQIAAGPLHIAADLRALDAATERLRGWAAGARLTVPPIPPEAPVYTAVDPGTPDAPTLTPAGLAAAQALRDAVRAKVEAAQASGRRVNVLELGQHERSLLGTPGHYLLELDGRPVDLVVRPVAAETALSVLYDPTA